MRFTTIKIISLLQEVPLAVLLIELVLKVLHDDITILKVVTIEFFHDIL